MIEIIDCCYPKTVMFLFFSNPIGTMFSLYYLITVYLWKVNYHSLFVFTSVGEKSAGLNVFERCLTHYAVGISDALVHNEISGFSSYTN